MPRNYNKLFRQFLIWKYKHISEANFIYILSILTGLLAGLGSVAFKNITHYIKELLEGRFIREIHHTLYFVFPIIGLFIVHLLKKYIIKRPIHHGIPSVLFSISKRNGIIESFKMYASLITATITVGFGGSVGLQGPAIGTGAAIGSNISRLFHMNRKKRILLIGCACAAAISSMFKAPITAIIFVLEIFSFDIALASLVPLLLASVSGVMTSYFFLGSDIILKFDLVDVFRIKDIPFYTILGIGTGIASVYFSKIFFKITRFFEGISSEYQRIFWGGLAIGTIFFFIPPLFGEGVDLINDLLHGNHQNAIHSAIIPPEITENIWVVITLLAGITIFKAVAMTITFSAGGVGGIFIPTLVMGSALGNVVAKIINHVGLGHQVSESNFTLLGMTGLMAGVLHAPLTSIFLIAEITGGYELFVPLMIVSAISFAMTRYFISHSIYTYELAKRGELITHNKDKNVLILLDVNKVIETNFIELQPEMLLGEILHKAVAKSPRNHFPVINDKREFLGVLLLDDIRGIMFDTSLYKKVTVSNLMQNAEEIISYEEDSMEDIMEKFKRTSAWNLPVTKKGKYYGFISRSRLLTAYRRKIIEVTA